MAKLASNVKAGFTPRTYDAVVDAAGGEDFTTLQSADDYLDSSTYTLYVKQGTYAAGVTVSTDGATIVKEPGTVVQAAITISGDNCRLLLGSGCDIQAVVTLSGDDCQLICENGCDLDGIVVSGARSLVDGGGWDTLVDGGIANIGISIGGSDNIIKNVSAQTTGVGGSAFHAIGVSGARHTIECVRVVDADDIGIAIYSSTDTDTTITGCVILGADTHGISVNGPRARIVGNYIINVGTDGVAVISTGDDSVIMANVIDNAGSNPIEIHADAENCVVVGNRTDGAIVDGSGTSIVAQNDETAF